jgi:SAM-dependent methyltransferase
VHTNVLWETEADARGAPRGDITLAQCLVCGLIWNTSFDRDVLSYDAEYENSLHFSEAFRRYTEELTNRLVAEHDLSGKHVAELGSGKGEFLAELCERGGCSGIGFDPSYAGESDGRAGGRLTFVRELFGADSDPGEASLVLCRHVLEHLDDPVGFLRSAHQALADRAARIYVEVPAAEYLLAEDAIWDVIYAHVTCFSAGALRLALRLAGFEPCDHGYSFGGQYLWVEAVREANTGGLERGDDRSPNGTVDEFTVRLTERRSTWAEQLPRLKRAGGVCVWGAGAKGTMFLNAIAAGDAVDAVVDVNPRKHGKFVPGTGQRIVGPDALAAGVKTIIVMNPIYTDEIRRAVAELGLEARLLVA